MSLSGLLNQTVTIYPKSSYNKYGREVVSSGAENCARVQEVSKSKLLPNGQTINIDLIVYLKNNVTVSINDKLDYLGTKYKVFSFSKPVDGSGQLHHIKIECIKWQET